MAVSMPAPAQGTAQAVNTTTTAPALHKALRDLWHGHVVATRDYALAVHAGDTSAADRAVAAVIANAQQISGAVAGFYGRDAGDALLKLLAGHWDGVKALTDAARAGDKAGVDHAVSDLVANGRMIAKFLAGANPNWTEGALEGALAMHASDHRTQVDLMMSNAPAAGQAREWTRMQQHMDMIADTLADGIARQFPDKAG